MGKFDKLKNIAIKKGDKGQVDVLDYLEQASNDDKKAAMTYLKDRNNTRALKEKEDQLSQEIQLGDIGKKKEYCHFISAIANEMLTEVGFKKGWVVQAAATEEGAGIRIYGKPYMTETGIVMVVKDPEGQVYVNAMKATGDSGKDLEMLRRFILAAEQTLTNYNKREDFLNLQIN